MCGLAGTWDRRGGTAEALRARVARMASTLAHRGPDDSGEWADPSAGLALAFRRLAIVDLSPAGHQPMASASGRYVMAFNGEVYNHTELRQALGRGTYRGSSDTETILACFERWGVEASLPHFIGMFAMAIWDTRLRVLHLVRDRLGIKPLFVARTPHGVAFGSELKALRALPELGAEVDARALAAYLRHLYVPAPYSILRGVTKLPPGTLLSVSDPAAPLPDPVRWWSLEEVARQGLASPFQGTETEAVDALEETIGDAVGLRMRADVPFGAFLSGGVDSSVVVALMQQRSSTPVRTFTIGFEEPEWDESAAAGAVARHLGTEHTSVRLSGGDALRLVPDLPDQFDEPMADPSGLPTFLVSRIARRDVVVALSGDGGDEILTGYNRYTSGDRAIRNSLAVPAPLRRAAAAALTAVPPSRWDAVARHAPTALGLRAAGDRVHKLAALLARRDAGGMYRSLVSQWQDPSPLFRGRVGERPDPGDGVLAHTGIPLMERMMLADQLGYLPDDLLAKLDRASMAVSLEARVPLLDHRVVALAWRFPRALRVRGGRGKWALRQVLYRHVPPALVDRPKAGFSVPIGDWLRGPLRPWAEALLDPRRIRERGLLDETALRAAWTDLLAGRGRGALGMWAVLVYLAWEERWMRPVTATPRIVAGVA